MPRSASGYASLTSETQASLTDRAYGVIEEAIVTLALAPGAATSEAALSEHFGLGRTPVREALQRLAREGLVEISPRRGVAVSPIDPARQLRLLEIRREVERLLARLGARRADAVARIAFAALAAGMDEAATNADEIGFMRLDRDYNRLFLAAAANPYATAAMRLTNGLSRRFWYANRGGADLDLTARLHAAVARAIAAGDEPAAAAASDALVDHIETLARAMIG